LTLELPMNFAARGLLAAALCLLALPFPAARCQSKQPPGATAKASPVLAASLSSEYRSKAYVIERYRRVYNFHADGTWEETTTARIRVQSQAGVRIFGDLALPYESKNQRAKIGYVRVVAPDGTVTDTPASNVQDVPAAVTLSAPVYSDLRVKEIPVTNLNPGDTLEFQFHTIEFHPEVPNQFWLSVNFLTDDVVLDDEVQVSVPANKYVQVVSTNVQPLIRKDGGEKIYEWKTSHLRKVDTDDAKNRKKTADKKPSIQITTFKSWQELGEWYRGLAASRAAVTPAIQKKEQEITAGLTTDAAKQQAIYSYVSTQIHYIALNFGIGRLQPHFAETVLHNKYGDCKDKHTLFAALMKAAGYDVWPALIGVGIKLDPDVPSLAQFNHVISVLPNGKQITWLDTTEEVAPFGMLDSSLREKQALVIPATGEPSFKKTPANPPFSTSFLFNIKATLSDKDVLTGHVDMKMRGDSALLYRALFRAVPQENWNKLMQRLSYSLGFGGEVSNAEASDPDATEEPFHVQYDYTRKDYNGRDGKWIFPPFPPVPFVVGEDSKQPDDAIPLGTPGVRDYQATVTLPKGKVAMLVAEKSLQTDFADYRKTSSVKDGVLIAERSYKVKLSKLPASRWDDYLKFVKAVDARENSMINLVPSKDKNSISTGYRDSREANQLLIQADKAIFAGNLPAAEGLLRRARALNPTQFGMGEVYGDLYHAKGELDRAIASYQEEMARHPDNKKCGQWLARMFLMQNHPNKSAKVLENLLRQYPGDVKTTEELAAVRMLQKRYGDAVTLLKQIEGKPGASKKVKTAIAVAEMEARIGGAQSKAEKKKLSVAALEEAMRAATAPMAINNVAYELAQNDADLVEAQQYAQKALKQVETSSSRTTLADVTVEDLLHVIDLAAIWDTVGWLEFKQGEIQKAEKYVTAAWDLSQGGEVGDHLGQIHEKEGNNRQAARMYRLALAAGGLEDAGATRQRLTDLEKILGKPVKSNDSDDGVELIKLRTVSVAKFIHPKGIAYGRFFVLLSRNGVEDTRFVSGTDAMRGAREQLEKAKFPVVFPDDGPETIVRAGILSCSPDSSACNFVLLPPKSVPPEMIQAAKSANHPQDQAAQ
jgi:tetratricopeptide (TPR) repeat protein